ncbi:LLM class flavin-dependent oxidoreductase [Umezawaea endophytica]|uniref:LLM class flavin-dependent oxidoreductase n=1 Tax=Umezawaea endophytica TaxID=1654476 RepID=A0A9X2VHU2_9PSEU|nr:LLM class flavin-dependent oxidoreductase [Umezawaea endophytica]MCS7476757.1 LLM class flavin-dependent oxidoreductase [Umezawaea endophytica]
MDLSLFYFANDNCSLDTDRYELLLSGARFADANDFTAVWTPERHFHAFGGIYPNPAVTGAAIAAVTSRVGIRAGSVVSPLHHPLRIAEEWSVVDNLSGGRVGISLASGWHASDFVLRPENYDDRRQVVLDHVDQIRRLWRGDSMSALDGAGGTSEVRIFPPPVQRELPIWVTSAGGVDTFRNAGRIGAGLLTHLLGQDVDDLAEKIAEYRKASAEQGFPGHVVLMVHTFLGDDEDEVREVVREPMSNYLRSSINLLLGSRLAGARKIDPAKLRESEVDFLVRRSFDRYYDDGGLLGTVPKAVRAVERARDIGVDEIACLIDFGVDTKRVLAGLARLNELRLLVRNTA